MTRFWWVRHGPTHLAVFTGWRDVPADLSDHASIARLDAYLPRGALLISSDLIRASATAAVLARGRQPLPASAALREFNLGDWDGKRFDEVAASHPKLSRLYWEQPGDIAPPQGESWNSAAARVSTKVTALLQAHAGRDIVAVAHIGVILTQLQVALGISAAQALGHRIDNLSVTCLTHGPGGWRVDGINHIP
jgi:alpha-ribazole phosphatase